MTDAGSITNPNERLASKKFIRGVDGLPTDLGSVLPDSDRSGVYYWLEFGQYGHDQLIGGSGCQRREHGGFPEYIPDQCVCGGGHRGNRRGGAV